MHHITQSTSYKAVGPYSLAVKTGNLLFCSGVIGTDPQGILPQTFEEQVTNIFRGIVDVLAQEQLGLKNVVKTTCFLADIADYAKFNELYAVEFGDHRPARSCVQAAALPKGARVEIEVVAEIPHH
jgi:2-iminobutanoate/2-iminopropanoate deaminase